MHLSGLAICILPGKMKKRAGSSDNQTRFAEVRGIFGAGINTYERTQVNVIQSESPFRVTRLVN